jgi:hypothetical protein
VKIHCPCDRIAEAKVVNGIVMYEHEDGSSCKLLNRFYNNKCASLAWKFAKKAICNNDHEMFAIYICKDNKEVIQELLGHIRLANKQELTQVLVFLFEKNDVNPQIQKYILDSLLNEYGNTAYKNIKAIRNKNFMNDPLLNRSVLSFPAMAKSKMFNIESYVNIENNTAKQNIVNDLARSFLLDKVMRDSTLKNAIKSFSR